MIIHAKVKPGALRDNITKLEDGSYLISVTERAENGKANISVIKLIAKEFGVSFKNVLVKSSKSRKKNC